MVVPGLTAGAPPPGRGSPHQRGRHLLPARGLDPADGETGRDPGHHPAVRFAGVEDGRADLDAQVEAFCTRPLDGGPYTFVAADALVLKVREEGRVVAVHVLAATGVNADGHREVLGLQVTSAEDGAEWLAFFRDLTAAIGATCPGRPGRGVGPTARRT